MATRTLYSPRLDNDLVRRLYREARRQGRPMILVLDQVVRGALPADEPLSLVAEPVPADKGRDMDAA